MVIVWRWCWRVDMTHELCFPMGEVEVEELS